MPATVVEQATATPAKGTNWRFGVHLPVRLEGLSLTRKFCIHTVIEEITPRGFRFRAQFEAQVGDLMAVYLPSKSARGASAYAGQARILALDNETPPLISCRAQMLRLPNALQI